MKDDTLNNFKQKILRARPTKAEFDMLVKIAQRIGTDETKSLLELFEERPSLIANMIKNINVKGAALKKGDLSSWYNIVAEEEKELTKTKEQTII